METKEKVDLIVMLIIVSTAFIGFGFWLGYEKGIKENKEYTIEKEANGFKIFNTYRTGSELIKSDTIKIY